MFQIEYYNPNLVELHSDTILNLIAYISDNATLRPYEASLALMIVFINL